MLSEAAFGVRIDDSLTEYNYPKHKNKGRPEHTWIQYKYKFPQIDSNGHIARKRPFKMY